MKVINPNPLSFSSLFLEAYFGDSLLGIASGFTWKDNNSNYLITNGHVVSGLHPVTGQPLDKNGATPDFLRVWLHVAEKLGSWESYDLPLYDSQSRPLWKEHKIFGSKADVALLNINTPEKIKVFPVNSFSFADFRVEISQDVFIVGFPRGITGAGKLPIWKRGSIASEPDIDLDGLPKVLIDSTTREGMSGSPVFTQFVGFHTEDPEHPSDTDWIGMGRKFLGIYSGRILGQDEFEAQLGIVWKASIIEEIVVSGVRPK